MKTIYKYHLSTHVNEIEMHKGAEVICAKEQFDEMFIWAIVDTDLPLEKRTFTVVGTGHVIPDCKHQRYIDTVSLSGGNYIFHIFEYKENK